MKDVVGYEGLYTVTPEGEVFGRSRTKARKLHICNSGYRRVTLYKDKKYRSHSVHRLVAQAYLNNPERKPDVNHKDGNKLNNSVANLEWVTKSENVKHAFATLGRKSNQQGRVGFSSVSGKPVRQLTMSGEFVAEFGSVNDAARQTGICGRGIAYAIEGIAQKTCGGFRWVRPEPKSE